jgi:hypothetical protein
MPRVIAIPEKSKMFVRSQKACVEGAVGGEGRAATVGFEPSVNFESADEGPLGRNCWAVADCPMKRQTPHSSIAILNDLSRSEIAIARRTSIL